MSKKAACQECGRKAAIRWGIIGCGDVTEVKSGPALQRAEGSELVAVMRRHGHLARDYARRHGVPRWYEDAGALLADPEVEAVYVATPVGTHREYALRACAAGKPTYVEKPMARNHRECRQMVHGFRQAGIPLFVAYYRRALPRFLKVKELIESGSLGTITSVSCRYLAAPSPGLWGSPPPESVPWRLNAEHSGGGLFLDLGSHALDIIDFLLGPLEGVHGQAANRASPYRVEDTVVMHFHCRGVPGVGLWSFASSKGEDCLEIVGSQGRVSLPVFGNEPIRFFSAAGSRSFPLSNPKHIEQALIQTVVDALLGRGSCPSTGESAARTSRVMDTVLADYYGGREDDFWNRPHAWPGASRR